MDYVNIFVQGQSGEQIYKPFRVGLRRQERRYIYKIKRIVIVGVLAHNRLYFCYSKMELQEPKFTKSRVK